MKNKLIVLLLIIASFKLNATNDSTTVTKINDSTSVIKNGIGITVSPMLAMPYYKSSSTLYPGFSFAAGVSGNLVLSKKHKLYLGVALGYLTNSGIQKNIPNVYSVTISPNGNVTYTNQGYFSTSTRFNYNYLALSLQKVVAKISAKMYLFAGIGAQLNYNFTIRQSTKNRVDYNGNNLDSTYHWSGVDISQNFSASAFAKIGLMTNLTQNLSFFVAPVFYYDLNPQVLFKNNNARFNNLGINLQLMYAF
ncbi:MAG TPA: hypothetical protein VK835_08270 [Bacteroidia bacterium]|jgi:hypothetical protein|nr:hypothetical protein [Bacteroidia bacterium]